VTAFLRSWWASSTPLESFRSVDPQLDAERETFYARSPDEPGPPSRSGADPRSRVLAGLLIAVALVAFVVCLAAVVLA
jgi:hypothetical protein